jgi:excisionase family DNA binding protein
MEKDYVTPREIAKRLRVDYATVMRWIRTGLLEAETIREGKRNRHRINKATLAALETPSPALPDSGFVGVSLRKLSPAAK